jgi:NADP-dependent 3-hydroxy acid dehydrogenase YdfG
MATALVEAGASVMIAARKVDRCAELCKRLMKDTGALTLGGV